MYNDRAYNHKILNTQTSVFLRLCTERSFFNQSVSNGLVLTSDIVRRSLTVKQIIQLPSLKTFHYGLMTVALALN